MIEKEKEEETVRGEGDIFNRSAPSSQRSIIIALTANYFGYNRRYDVRHYSMPEQTLNSTRHDSPRDTLDGDRQSGQINNLYACSAGMATAAIWPRVTGLKYAQK